MSTREARTRATRRWREKTNARLVQAYLHADIVEKLDALVTARGAGGRAAVLAELIEAAAEPATSESQNAPAPIPTETKVEATERPYTLRKRPEGGWMVLVNGEPIGYAMKSASGIGWEAVRTGSMMSSLRPAKGRTLDGTVRRMLVLDAPTGRLHNPMEPDR